MATIDLHQIHPRAFAHPIDRAAMNTLGSVPVLPTLIKKIRHFQFEKKFRAMQMHRSVEISSHQLPSLWRMVNTVAERLGIPSPNCYVSAHGGVNAFAFGVEKFSIILTSELIDLMNDRELEAIIAHELAHVMCEHMLYRQVGLALCSEAVASLTKIGPASLIQMGVSHALLSWYRASEYTADRAALLVLGDPGVIASCMARLAGVPRRFQQEFDPVLFLEQARRFDEEEDDSFWSKIVKWDAEAFMTHPEPVKRAAAILDWHDSEDYRRIISGQYWTWFDEEANQKIQIEGVRSCLLCNSPIGDHEVCPQCHLNQDPNQQQYCSKGHLNALSWKFCRVCGGPLTKEHQPPAATPQ